MKKLILTVSLILSLIPFLGHSETVLILEGNKQLMASGVVIKSTEAYSVILTARHVCDDAKEFYVRNATSELSPAIVFGRHMNEDVCVMLTPGLFKVNKVARNPLNMTDKAPQGLLLTLFPGKYAGLRVPIIVLNKDIMGGMNGINVTMFKPYIYPGTSGSPILSKRGEVEGIVSIRTISDIPEEQLSGYVDLEAIHDLLTGTNTLYRDNPSILMGSISENE